MSYTLHHGNCLDILPTLPADSIHAVVADPPFGTTKCHWDTIIPLTPLWQQLERVLVPDGAVVLFSQQPFTSQLTISKLAWYRAEWIWEKNQATGFLNAKKRPLKAHENILVFSPAGEHAYYSQKTDGHKAKKTTRRQASKHYGNQKATSYHSTERYPRSVLRFNTVPNNQIIHPTQKPVDLLAYLIRTYTRRGEKVLDFACGSGSTGVATVMNGRCFIGIDNGICQREGAFRGWRWVDVAAQRIGNAVGEFSVLPHEAAMGKRPLFEWGIP